MELKDLIVSGAAGIIGTWVICDYTLKLYKDHKEQIKLEEAKNKERNKKTGEFIQVILGCHTNTPLTDSQIDSVGELRKLLLDISLFS